MGCVADQERKKVAAALNPIYTAPTADAAEPRCNRPGCHTLCTGSASMWSIARRYRGSPT
jgi:hypothetical protein